MTRIGKITFGLFLLNLTLTQCGQYSDATFVSLDKSSIDSVTMTTRDNKLHKKLTKAQVDELVKSINSSKSVGLYKGVVTYRLHFYQTDRQTKDTSTRFIMASGPHFKFKYETGDETFTISDSTLFERLAINCGHVP